MRLIESKVFVTWGMTVKGDQRILFESDYKREFTEDSGESWGSTLDTLIFNILFPTVLNFMESGKEPDYDWYRNLSQKKLVHGIDIFLNCEIRKHRDGRQTPAFFLKIGDQSFQSLEASWVVSFIDLNGNVTFAKNFEKNFRDEKSWGVNLLPNLPTRKMKIKIAFNKFNVKY